MKLAGKGFNPDPWRKGFSPPSKCPACGRLYTLAYTGQRNQLGDHIYHCGYCGSFIGAPTDYAFCERFGVWLEKDVFYSPCSECPYRQPVPGRGVCRWWRKEKWWGDTDRSEFYAKTRRKVYIPAWGYKGEEAEG